MTKRILTAAATVAAALALTVTTSSAAQADVVSGTRVCTTAGAVGGYEFSNYHGPDARIAIRFYLSDTSNDGHNVRVRLISKNVRGTIKYWAWHANLDGPGTTKHWNTTASDSSGLFDIGVQIARFRGNTILNACAKW